MKKFGIVCVDNSKGQITQLMDFDYTEDESAAMSEIRRLNESNGDKSKIYAKLTVEYQGGE